MGCDIHSCIEYAELNEFPRHYTPFACELTVGRDYDLFALLAGVRSEEGVVPVVEPRGLPEDVSRTVLLRAACQIDDELAALEVDGYCSREEAEQWVRGRASVRITENVITHPDWHSASWLSAVELKEVQRRYRGVHGTDHREIGAIIAAMRALDADQGALSRLVFWFIG